MSTIEKAQEQTVFQKLQLLMDYIDLRSSYIAVSDKNEVERLHVNLNNPGKDLFPIIVKIMFINDINKAFNKSMADGSPDTRDLLDFYVDYPVIVNDKNVLPINVLLMKFNSFLPIGSFCINDKNNVYFRYVLVTEERDVAPTVFVEILDMITFYLDVLGKEILELYQERQTLEQSIENGIKNMMSIIEGEKI